MQHGSSSLAVTLLAIPLTSLASSVEPPDLDIDDETTLVQALAGSSQSSDLARIAARADGRVLARALGGNDLRLVKIALSLAPHVPEPGRLLPAILGLTGSRDRDIASRAARAASGIAAGMRSRTASCVDDGCDILGIDEAVVDGLRQGLGDEGSGADVLRDLLSILATEAGTTWAPNLTNEVEDLLEDRDPRVRAAAATIMTPPRDDGALEALLESAAQETDPSSASTLLTAACTGLGKPASRRHEKAFEKALGRVLGLDPMPAGVLAPVDACLAGIGTPWSTRQAAMIGGGVHP